MISCLIIMRPPLSFTNPRVALRLETADVIKLLLAINYIAISIATKNGKWEMGNGQKEKAKKAGFAQRLTANAQKIKATARASMLKPWPTGPSFSAVLAFTLTRPTSSESAVAIFSRMAGM